MTLWSSTSWSRTSRGWLRGSITTGGGTTAWFTYVKRTCGRGFRRHRCFRMRSGNAHATLIMTAHQQRIGFPDGDRGYRYANLDAGMLGGRVYLQTVGLNLGCCGIGAYFDDEVSELIGVSPDEELVVYLAAIGVPAGGE